MGDEPGWARFYVGKNGGPPRGQKTRDTFMRYVAFDQDPGLETSGSALTFNFEEDPWRLGTLSYMPEPPSGYNLSEFRESGGKLILYHGWNDETLTPAASLDFYSEQAELLGGKASLDPFFRLFMIPGMRHCGAGPGADAVDFLSAIEGWTERGEAPYRLIAYKLAQKETSVVHYPRFPKNMETAIFSRPLFPYPDVAIYDGFGPPDSAESFIRSKRP